MLLRLQLWILGMISIIVICMMDQASIVAHSENQDNYTTRKAVFMVFRHGARTPLRSYRNDPHKNYSWPGGFGALTIVGINQLYRIGAILETRYKLLMPNNKLYSTKFMHVRSSNYERCLQSGLSFLASFMRLPKNEQVLDNTNCNWQPIPMHTLPQNEDYLLAQEKPCPNYYSTFVNALQINYSDPEIKMITNGDPEQFFEYISDKSGEQMKSLSDIDLLQDVLKVELENNLSLPEWVTPDIYRMLKYLVSLKNLRMSQCEYTQILGGALLNHMVKYFQALKHGSTQNIIINSAHDDTLLSLFGVLKIINQTATIVEYAATLVAELYQNAAIKDDFEIRFYYFENSNNITEPKLIDISQCSKPCSLENFKTVFESKLVKNYDEICYG